MKFFGLYIWNILIGIFDQGLNTLLFGAPDETISSRLGRSIESGRPKWFVIPIYKSLNFVFRKLSNQKNHAKESIEPKYATQKELWSWIEPFNYIPNKFERLMKKWLK